MKILYIKCLCKSEHRQLAFKLKREGYEIRQTDQSLEHRKEAKDIGLTLPFTIVNGQAKEL